MQKRHIPNMLTIGRMVAVPVFVLCFWLPMPLNHILMLVLFLLASLTDWADGYLARKWGAGSDLGRMLDPIADKLLVAAALLVLAQEGLAPLIPVLLILLRELLVSGLRESLGAKGVSLPVSFLAKCKTALQMIAVASLLTTPLLESPDFLRISQYVLWGAGFLTAYTGVEYLIRAVRVLRV